VGEFDSKVVSRVLGLGLLGLLVDEEGVSEGDLGVSGELLLISEGNGGIWDNLDFGGQLGVLISLESSENFEGDSLVGGLGLGRVVADLGTSAELVGLGECESFIRGLVFVTLGLLSFLLLLLVVDCESTEEILVLEGNGELAGVGELVSLSLWEVDGGGSSEIDIVSLDWLGDEIDVDLVLLGGEWSLLVVGDEVEESLGEWLEESDVQVDEMVCKSCGECHSLFSWCGGGDLCGDGKSIDLEDFVVELCSEFCRWLALCLESELESLDLVEVDLGAEVCLSGGSVKVGDAGIEFNSLLSLG